MPELLKDIRRKALHETQFREMAISRDLVFNDDDRSIILAFASDQPCESWMGDLVLNTQKSAVRMERVATGLLALLMDHDRTGQIGSVDSFDFGADGIIRATVRFSRSVEGEEIFQDVKDGIRRGVSVGFQMYGLKLVEQRDGENDLYQCDDWEPIEISLVSIPADTATGVGRSKQLSNSNTPPVQRASSTNTEKTMPEINANEPEAPVVETRSANEKVAAEIIRWGESLGHPELARHFAAAERPSVEDFMKAARERIPQPQPLPVADPAAAQQRDGGFLGFEKDGEVLVNKRTREILESEGTGLTEKQMATISTRTYKIAFENYVRNTGLDDLGNSDRRALAEGTDSAGGFLVPAEFIAKMIERLPAATEIQSQVTGLTTGSDKVILPKNVYNASNLYTTGVRVTWVDEVTGVTSESSGAEDFGNITIPVHTAMLFHDITNNMIEDSTFDIMGWLQSKFRETVDVVTENLILNGTGQGQPAGILLNVDGANQPASVLSGVSGALGADGLLALNYTLLGRYTPNARFVFNRISTQKAIAQLKDTQNRYLFAYGANDNGVAGARPTELLGFPFIVSDFMPDVAANAFPIIFGDLKGYYLVRRVGFSIQVLREIVATGNKVRVLGRMRIGGQVAEDWRLKIQKVSP